MIALKIIGAVALFLLSLSLVASIALVSILAAAAAKEAEGKSEGGSE